MDYKLGNGYGIQGAVSLARLTPEGAVTDIQPFEPQRHIFAFDPDGEMPEFSFVFSELTLEQFAFFAGVVKMTQPTCLRPTPWRRNW